MSSGIKRDIMKDNVKFNHTGVKGLNVIGYFQKTLGVGEVSRLIVASLKKQAIPCSLISGDFLIAGQDHSEFHQKVDNDFTYPINLFCLDSRHIPLFVHNSDWSHFKNRYNIGLLFWETNKIENSFRKCWEYLDEIWVTSRYVQEQLSIATSKPVHRISQPIQISHTPARIDKKRFNLANKFTFLFCFNFLSIVDRKNPLAIVQAFQQAFPHTQDVQLVIKSQNGDLIPQQLASHLERIKGDQRIIWIDQNMSSQERFDLMNVCDCYISLHRSEGLGLTMAEAMLLEKPVIATGYSGNLDFMNEENSFLCPYTFVPIGPNHYPYPEDGLWADADIDQAAFWMNYVVKNPIESMIKAKRGKQFILEHHSDEVVGQQISQRLNQIALPIRSKPKPWSYKRAKIVQDSKKRLPFLLPMLRPIKNKLSSLFKNR